MGESACLMQPFCYASGISNEANESNPIHALGQSVSFGRFSSESLSWEKWSTFSHNRYVEEAERYSRPGSVAQKKAFFEAHYKKLAAQKAAALLEQANNAASNTVQEQHHEGAVEDVFKTHDLQTTCPNTEQVVEAINSDPVATLSSTGHDSNSRKSESNRIDWADPEREQEASVAVNSMKVELQNQLSDVDNSNEINEKIIETPRIDKPHIKQNNNSDQEVSGSGAKSKKKPSVSSSKLLKDNGASKFTCTPAKYTTSIPSNKDNFATPMSNKPALGSADKKRATPRSLHMTVNFTPIRELNRLTASVMRRFETSRVGAASSSKPSKDSSILLRTPTMASKNHASVTPLTESTRNKTPLGSSVSGSKTGPKWRLLSAEKKMRSPVISSPFSLRTEERAARRKKKLEEKFNANEAQKVQLHTKLKEKAETEIRKLRQSFCFKARPLPDFYKERKASQNEITKEPLTMTYPESSPREGRKPSCSWSVVENKSSLPPQRPSMKKNFLGKNGRSNSMNINHENTSPNILQPTQHDGND